MKSTAANKFKVDWISRKDAQLAVKKWHYSKCFPNGATVCIGFWENDVFIGTVIFGNGSCPQYHVPFSLKASEVCELVRVALNSTHVTTTSSIIKKSIDFLKKNHPYLKLIISYADAGQEHCGIIYQATNWFYLGTTKDRKTFFMYEGIKRHMRTLSYHKKNPNFDFTKVIFVPGPFKHKYVFPLDKRAKKKLLKAKLPPYPKKDDHLRPFAKPIDLS